jgi:hypothetical protein
MIRRLTLVLALAFVVCMAFNAYAEVQNVKVSGDLSLQGVSREAFDLGSNLSYKAGPSETDATLMITRLKVDADLTDNVMATVGIRNEQVWGTSTRTTTGDGDFHISLGFVTLKEFFYDWLTLKLGYQPVRLGSTLLIGDADTNRVAAGPLAGEFGDLSTKKSFNGLVAMMDFNPLTLTLGAVKAAEGDVSLSTDDQNVYVVNADYDTGVMKTIGSVYYVQKDANKADIHNVGMRVTSMPIDNLNLSAEYAQQFIKSLRGDFNHATANAILLGATYAMPEVSMKPSIGVDYARLSRNWDVMYEDMTPADIFNAITPNTNAQVIGATATAKPMEDLSVKLRYINAKLVDIVNDTTIPMWPFNGAYYNMTANKSLGNEVDLHLTYDYTEDVKFGLMFGYFRPGGAFDKVNRKSASQVIGSMKVTF